MSNQITKVDLIPNGELSVCNVSQFDNGRVLPFEILENKEAYTIPNDIRLELHCRKPDGNIVTLPSENISDNIVTFLSTTQLTACYGKNICEIALYGPDNYLIGSGNFILDVERDPLLGGITSMTAIHNLEEQIEEITTEIIGEDYYNKSEVDDLLSGKANAADVYTKSQTDSLLSSKADSSSVYTKGQTDTLLNAKADVSDLPDMTEYYTKTATDALLDEKADADTTTAALATKADKSDTYTKEQVDDIIYNIFPVKTASGSIANFSTGLTYPLVSVTAAAGATKVTRCGINLFSNKFSDYTKPTNYYICKIPLKQGAIYTIKATLKGTAVTGCIIGIAQDNDSYPFVGQYSLIKTDGTTQTFPSITIDSAWVDPKLICYCSGETQFNSLFENYDIVLVEGTDTTYYPYTSNTVPVADAETLTTFAGVNNVYADAGDISVSYKYMSM